MKSDIEYFYNIKIEKLYNKENYYYFYYEFNTYYFIPTTRPIEDFQDIIKVENELANKGIFCHQFINNKEGKIITVLDEIKYVMLKIQMENEEIDLNQTYFVVTNDYLSLGGDNMKFFTKGVNKYIMDYKLRNVLLAYFEKNNPLPIITTKNIIEE